MNGVLLKENQLGTNFWDTPYNLIYMPSVNCFAEKMKKIHCHQINTGLNLLLILMLPVQLEFICLQLRIWLEELQGNSIDIFSV